MLTLIPKDCFYFSIFHMVYLCYNKCGDTMAEFIEILKYIILGIIQGITEIFPVSSSGHLTLFARIFNIDLSNLTIFLMITNTGSFLALLFYFKKDVSQLIRGTWHYLIRKEETSKEDFQYVVKLLIAVIPIGIFGLFFKDYLPNDLLSVGFALLLTGGLLYFVYRVKDIQWQNQITWKNALVIGAFQMFAIFPGISRSGITMTGGLMQKIELKKVLRFSFLSYIVVSVPVSLLGLYEALTISESINVLGYSLAFVMSFVFSLLSVRVLYQYVKVKNLIYFAVYCFIVGLFSMILYFI
ncbi:MAG: UDP pyrophosphate phosphatase [Tenericutes bacterium HGW-Tenericutes-3]|nr:MAG: UDP pyrophosphate phosphatase [Tenericutes bacterium HGW-Tenericutes-3]